MKPTRVPEKVPGWMPMIGPRPITDRRLTPADVRILLGLMLYARDRFETYVGQERLAGTVSVTERIIPSALRRLVACKYIRIRDKRSAHGTLYYELNKKLIQSGVVEVLDDQELCE